MLSDQRADFRLNSPDLGSEIYIRYLRTMLGDSRGTKPLLLSSYSRGLAVETHVFIPGHL
jgi:hypothetical protein